MLYCTTAGLILNSQSGRAFIALTAGSIASSGTLIATMLFHAVLSGGVSISGVRFDLQDASARFWILLAVIFAATIVAIFVACRARPFVLTILNAIFRMKLEDAKKVEKLIITFVKIGAAAALLFFAVV